MIDAVSVSAGVQWGPYIIAGLVLFAGALAWALRRVLARIDAIGSTVDRLTVDVAVLKDRQTLTAQKVGVTPKQLQDTEQ